MPINYRPLINLQPLTLAFLLCCNSPGLHWRILFLRLQLGLRTKQWAVETVWIWSNASKCPVDGLEQRIFFTLAKVVVVIKLKNKQDCSTQIHVFNPVGSFSDVDGVGERNPVMTLSGVRPLVPDMGHTKVFLFYSITNLCKKGSNDIKKISD